MTSYTETFQSNSPRSGFHSRSNRDERPPQSKMGSSAGYTEQVLASSADISSSPESSATGEVFEESEEVSERNVLNEEADFYASESDELEMARAVLEAATQSASGKHDPSAALAEIEETDDDPDTL